MDILKALANAEHHRQHGWKVDPPMSTVHVNPTKRANFISKMVVVPITAVLPNGIQTPGHTTTVRRTMWKCEVYSTLFDKPIHITQNSLSEHSAVLRASFWIKKEGYVWADLC